MRALGARKVLRAPCGGAGSLAGGGRRPQVQVGMSEALERVPMKPSQPPAGGLEPMTPRGFWKEGCMLPEVFLA